MTPSVLLIWPRCNRSLSFTCCPSRARETIEASYKLRQWLQQRQKDLVSLIGHLQQQLASLEATKLCRGKGCHLHNHLGDFTQVYKSKNSFEFLIWHLMDLWAAISFYRTLRVVMHMAVHSKYFMKELHIYYIYMCGLVWRRNPAGRGGSNSHSCHRWIEMLNLHGYKEFNCFRSVW